MSGKIEENKMNAVMIIEIMGRPKEHLIQTLEALSKEISEEKGVKIVTKKINEPVLAKDQKDLFTTFAEIEIEVEDPLLLTILMFKYMPSHLEIVEPEKFILTNVGFGDILNEITRRLHRYEELVRVMQIQMQAQAQKVPQLKVIENIKEEKKESKKGKGKSKKK
ncbi:hypothetical protein J4412_01125 [Candidatus Pacearchaeota archaeon]|nr:MAG: hypothetical protein QJ16_C0022G0007 [archaeon GW2011_AR1]MBS3078092.1 hypothetical protein [Candidatus Pacearchaeota archaeon]HIH52340.1 hypothetical protein [Nanoarchaeota archaeon]